MHSHPVHSHNVSMNHPWPAICPEGHSVTPESMEMGRAGAVRIETHRPPVKPGRQSSSQGRMGFVDRGLFDEGLFDLPPE